MDKKTRDTIKSTKNIYICQMAQNYACGEGNKHNSNQDMYILMNGLKYGQTDTNISMDYPAKKLGHIQADILLLYVFFFLILNICTHKYEQVSLYIYIYIYSCILKLLQKF